MSDDATNLRPFPAAVTTGRMRGQYVEWSDDIRKLAYQLWAGDGGRNIGRVAAMLAEMDNETAVPARTIRYWSQSEDWEAKADFDIAQIGQVLLHRTIARLVAGAPSSASYLVNVANGSEKPDKTRVMASMAILDRVGIGPRRSEGDLPALPTTTTQRRDYRSMSDEELARLERGE